MTTAIVGGCAARGRDRSWNIGMPDFGEVLADWICDGDSEYDGDYDRTAVSGIRRLRVKGGEPDYVAATAPVG